MRHPGLFRWWAMLFMAAVAAGCADSTLPKTGVGETAPRSVYQLEPVVVVGQPTCDPWTSLSWCEDSGGGCTMSTGGVYGADTGLAGCTGPGTGGGGTSDGTGSTGGGTGGTPTSPTEPSSASKDGTGCPNCGERAPTETERTELEAQIATMQCQDVKDTLTRMLNAGTLMVYDKDDGHWGSWNSSTQRIYVSRTRHWGADGTVKRRELGDTMAHEGVHKLLGHVNGMSADAAHDQAFKDKMASCGFPQP